MPLQNVNPPTVLLFDLGGVLVESIAFERLNELLPHPVDSDRLKARWLASPVAREFERGRLGPAEFARGLVVEWGLRCTPAALLGEYRDWVRGFYPGAMELLGALRARYRVACLSNSNEVHWGKFDGFAGHFEPALASHLMGTLKPDAECFDQAVRACTVPAQSIAFFDDSAPNVTAAARRGLRAYRVDGPQGVMAVLAREGWSI